VATEFRRPRPYAPRVEGAALRSTTAHMRAGDVAAHESGEPGRKKGKPDGLAPIPRTFEAVAETLNPSALAELRARLLREEEPVGDKADPVREQLGREPINVTACESPLCPQ
jgi:hypothetical protein